MFSAMRPAFSAFSIAAPTAGSKFGAGGTGSSPATPSFFSSFAASLRLLREQALLLESRS